MIEEPRWPRSLTHKTLERVYVCVCHRRKLIEEKLQMVKSSQQRHLSHIMAYGIFSTVKASLYIFYIGLHLYVWPLCITFEIFSSAKHFTENFNMLRKKPTVLIFGLKSFFLNIGTADKRIVQPRRLRTMKLTITAEKLIICVSQHQALFGKQLAKMIKQWSQKCLELAHCHPERCQEAAVVRFQPRCEAVKLSIPNKGVYLRLVFSFSWKTRWGKNLHRWTNFLHFWVSCKCFSCFYGKLVSRPVEDV